MSEAARTEAVRRLVDQRRQLGNAIWHSHGNTPPVELIVAHANVQTAIESVEQTRALNRIAESLARMEGERD